jgi:hypothetical protein
MPTAEAGFSADGRYRLYLDVWQGAVSGNSSRIDWRLNAVKFEGSGFWRTNVDSGWSVSVAGGNWSGAWAYDFRGSTPKTITIATGNIWVGHDGNGYLNIWYSAWAEMRSGQGSAAPSGGPWGLPRIARRPYAPSTPAIGTVLPTSVALSWSPPGDNGGTGITGYEIQRATNAAFTAGVVTTGVGGATSATLTGLTPATDYWFRVRAINGAGAGDWSGVSTARPLGAARVRYGGTWRTAIPYVRQGGVWRISVPYVNDDGTWRNAG